MSGERSSTRRAFVKGGAILAAPLAAAAPALAMADEGRRTRLTRREDEAAIRDLHQAWLRRVNTGEDAASLFADPRRAAFDQAVRGVAVDHAGAPDAVELAANGLSATGRFQCVVETEADLGEDCTLAQMAHAQGGGFVRQTERRVLTADYVKTDRGWAIAEVGFAAAEGE